jgi:hypothetical protein
VRLRNHEIRQRINGNLKVEFARQDVTSFSGLELFRRYFNLLGLHGRIRRAFRGHEFKGDYSVTDYILVLIALWLTGGRRLRHVAFLADDPLVKRLCGLSSLPSDRSISRWLGQFTNDSLQALIEINSDVISMALRDLDPARITLDLDGTVLTCGQKIGWAFRGYNPHHRYAPSYYPLLCHIAQTGHFLQVRNRPGNVHDSKGALDMVQDCVAEVRRMLPGVCMEMRLDSAFFQRDLLKWLNRNGVEFTVKVPMCQWTGLKPAINSLRYWHHYTETISARRLTLPLGGKWNEAVEFVVIRHKISNNAKPKKYVQLDLFTPDDGLYEYSVLHTNKTLRPDHLWEFYNGRAAMEHHIAEIKGEFGFDVIPTRHYQGNSAHQLISVLAHNLVRNYQIDTHLATKRPQTQSRTGLLEFQSLKTHRFEWISAAARILNVGGCKILRITQNERRQNLWNQMSDRLDRLAA